MKSKRIFVYIRFLSHASSSAVDLCDLEDSSKEIYLKLFIISRSICGLRKLIREKSRFFFANNRLNNKGWRGRMKRNAMVLFAICTVLIWRMSVRYARRKSRFVRAARELIPKILNYSSLSIESNARPSETQSTLHHFPNPDLMDVARASINHHYLQWNTVHLR